MVRWSALAALLLAEVVALTVRFDGDSLAGNGRWWASWFDATHFLPQLLLTIAVTLAVFGGERLWTAVGAVTGAASRPHRWIVPLVTHLVAFGVFALVSRRLFEGSSGVAADVWLVAWVLLAGVVVVTWGLTLLPARAWWELVGRFRGALVLAVLGGVVAFAAGRLSEQLWEPMADITLKTVRGVLELVFEDLLYRPGIRAVGTQRFAVRVAPSCSGYEGLGLVTAFVGLYLWLRRHELRFPAALLLLPVGLVAAWVANIGRIVALIALGTWGWPEVARGGFHSQAGWLTFIAVALGLVAISRRSRWLSRTTAEREGTINPAAPYLLPLIAVVGTAMITGALSAGPFDAFYPVRVVVALGVFLAYARTYRGLGWAASPIGFGVGGGVFVLWMVLEFLLIGPPARQPVPAELAALPPGWQALWMIGRVIGGVVVVPLAEELAFRGYLLRRLQGAEFDQVPATRWSWPAVLVSSVLFGVLHPGRAVAGTLAGVLYAWAYTRRGRLADAVIAHAVTNAMLAAYVLLTGSWSLW